MRIACRCALVSCLAFLSLFAASHAATVRVTTWNLEWFPNGTPEEASAPEQEKHVQAAAEVLRALNPDIILVQEVKDYNACVRLAEAIKPKTYHVAICSSFREGRDIGKQQVAVIAKENAQAAFAEPWISMRGVDPPRGFAFAWFRLNGQGLGVYSIHLKANRISTGRKGGDAKAQVAQNIAKREVAIEQLLAHVRDVIPKRAPGAHSVLVAGDFNTNRDEANFAQETTLTKFTENGFRDSFEGLAAPMRVTHPAAEGFPDTTFDYVFVKNAAVSKPIITRATNSDHLPVTLDLELGQTNSPLASAPPEAKPPAETTAAANINSPPAPPPPSVAPQPTPDQRVWVHIPTRLYFRPGAALYGRTDSGTYMKESEALRAGYKAAAVR